jgi:hypothetical protein
MNKNHLLPALLFVLAACGGTASSASSSSAPASSSAPSSAPVDNNEYRLVGNQSNIGGWTAANAPVLTRATGTNSFSITVDLYKDAEWKIIIGTVYDGALSPTNSTISIIDKGVTWTKDNLGAFIVPADGNTGAKSDGYSGLNFVTLVDGSYTLTFVSLPVPSRALTITRNGNPIVPPPTTLDFYLVGNFTTPNWGEGFVPANAFTETSVAGTFEKTLDLLIGNEFKIVRMLGTTPTWLGAPNVDITLLPSATPVTIGGTDNFTVSVHGNYKVTLVNGAKPAVTFNRLGNPIVPPPAPEVDPANWFLVGSITNDGTDGSGWNPADKEFAMTPVSGQTGVYEITLSVNAGDLFKVKTGDTWTTGRDLGFSAVTSVTTTLFSNVDGNINSLVSGKFRVTYAFAPSAGTITIAPLGWIGYATVVTQGATSASIAYANVPTADWARNSQLRLTAPFDQTKEGVEFDFTGKADDNYLFKVEGPSGASELMVKATGAEQKLIVPVAQLNATQRAALNLFVIFARTDASTGTIVVRDWKYVDSVTPVAPTWLAVGTQVSVVNNVMTMTYTNTPGEFWNQHAQIAVNAFDGSKTSVTVPFTGVASQEYMFKFEYPGHTNNVEFRAVATGAAQTVIMNLANLTPEIRATINKFVVFSTTTGASGSVTVSPYYYTPVWMAQGEGATAVMNGTAMTFTYTARGEFYFQNAQIDVVGFDGSKSSVTVSFTGVAGQEYMFKFEYPGHTNNVEFRVVATGAAQTAVLNLAAFSPEIRASFNKFVVFNFIKTEAGSITVTSWAYTA